VVEMYFYIAITICNCQKRPEMKRVCVCAVSRRSTGEGRHTER